MFVAYTFGVGCGYSWSLLYAWLVGMWVLLCCFVRVSVGYCFGLVVFGL